MLKPVYRGRCRYVRIAKRLTIRPSGFPAAIGRHGRNLRNIYIPIHTGGHSGPPLRRGFVSVRGNLGAEPDQTTDVS